MKTAVALGILALFAIIGAASGREPGLGCLLGDVNNDGAVDLLDVAPFIDRLNTGTYQCEADVNADGAVNLLDVDPFVSIITGG